MKTERIQQSAIVALAREAFSYPDVKFLCFGESDQESPKSARDSLKQALDEGNTRYGDVRGMGTLREAIATYLSKLHRTEISEDRIQVTASGMAAIGIAMTFLIKPGDRVVIHEPMWQNIANVARARFAEIDIVSLKLKTDGSFFLDIDALHEKLKGARLFFLNSPNNPSGWVASEIELKKILAICRETNTWIVTDEVYSRLIYNGSSCAPSMLSIVHPNDRVISCNSFSKTWAMTGWRIGWLVVPKGLRDTFCDVTEITHSAVSQFIQYGALAALSDSDFIEEFRSFCDQGRQIAVESLNAIKGIEYIAPPGTFYAFFKIPSVKDSLQFSFDLLKTQRVAVAPGIGFGQSGEGFIRICFAKQTDELREAMDRLSQGILTYLSRI